MSPFFSSAWCEGGVFSRLFTVSLNLSSLGFDMDKRAIKRAKDRLRKAGAAVSKLETAQTFEQINDAWFDFLIASSGVYEQFREGCKSSPKSTTWYAQKKGERKKDRLLQYVHQARNSDYHGIQYVTEPEPELRLAGYGDGRLASFSTGGLVTVTGTTARLITVVNTDYGDRFDPPTSHQGKPLSNPSPIIVARLTMTYLEQLVAEAEALP